MIRKLVSFLLCLSPLSAMGVTYNPGTGNAVGADGSLVGLNAGETIVIQSGNGIKVGADGITLAGNMYVGQDDQGSATGDMFIETGTDPVFSIISSGAINVAGTLDLRNGRTLGIGTDSGTINASFGEISSLGNLNIYNIATLMSGDITNGNLTNAGAMSLSAVDINAGAIANENGTVNITASGTLTMAQFVSNSAGLSTLTANNISSGNIQNNTGQTTITLTGNLTGTGSLENSGTEMRINAGGNIVIAGTVKNDSNLGSMFLTGTGLRITGGDAVNASLVNKGNFNATITGDTYLEYGFDLSAMGITNTFALTTDTLTFGNNMPADAWLQLFSNKLNSFKLVLNKDVINETTLAIVNGVGNAAANMDVTAGAITVNSVENLGNNLLLTATGYTGQAALIQINGGVTGQAGSTTKLISYDTLTVGGAAVNNGTMVLNGVNVNLNSVTNAGSLNISSLTDATGKITIGSTVVNNAGNLLIEAREIDINGVLTNNAGTTTVRGSDINGGAVSIAGIEALGGTINLNALIHSIVVDQSIVVGGGSLNFLSDTFNVTAGGAINIAGDITASAVAATGAGDVNIAASGTQNFVLKATNGSMTIGGNVSAVDNVLSRTVLFDATTIDITGDVTAANKGTLIFGDTLATQLSIDGGLISNLGGVIDLDVNNVTVGTLSGSGKFIVRGSTIVATSAVDNAISIEKGIWFDGSEPTVGMVVKGTNTLTLQTTGAGADINIGNGIAIGTGNKLILNSADKVDVAGNVTVVGELDLDAAGATTFTGMLTNNGTVTIDAASITTQDITNTATLRLTSPGNIGVNNVINSGAVTLSGAALTANAVWSTAGSIDVTADTFNLNSMIVSGGYINLNTDSVTVANDVNVTGDLIQGATTGMLNITQNNTTLTANNLKIDGKFDALNFAATYDVQNAFTIGGNLTVAAPASVTIDAVTFSALDVTNAGTLIVTSADTTLGHVTNTGSLTLNSGNTELMTVSSFISALGNTHLSGVGMNSAGVFTLGGKLVQNSTATLAAGDANILSNNYTIRASNVTLTDINQTSGKLLINTSDLDITGSIIASTAVGDNIRIAAQGTNWLNLDIGGSVSGNVGFIGLEKMTIGGDFTFTDGSLLHAAILPTNQTTHNYWATVDLDENQNLGKITNPTGAEPLITVNGKFISDLHGLGSSSVGALKDGQVGIDIFDIVDQGTAIWFIHANDGLQEDGLKTRNVVVQFCNADGSMCYNYLESLGQGSTNEEDLPAYLTLRDTDGDGIADSIYIVFDPRFGGPVEVFKIQPIVDREDGRTDGEYVTAGALDELIAGKLVQTGFFNRTPIEVIPLMFKGTNMEQLANELYNRMEQYQLDQDGLGLTRFSRLFQPREIEQIAGSIALNEHTSFRDFEDHMFNEFIWNRHRKIKNAWMDVDLGMFNQTVSDDKEVSGNRFSLAGGFDWQNSETLILGVTARVSNMSASNFDEVDLSYKAGQNLMGRVDLDVADTNIGLGGYMMKTLGTKARLYGNAYFDVHMLNVDREQNFVAPITGTGTAVSVITEWGLMHDILNQYIVGNAYVRGGYNFGFSVTEKAQGENYMDLKSDGYLVLTPGYSLVAQKRIYPSSWFQIRPNISVGVEYDVLGMPSDLQYKFTPALNYTDYNVEIDPLWANMGVGIEFISASGVQIGIDYRYQYNTDIQLHKVKLSGTYRF